MSEEEKIGIGIAVLLLLYWGISNQNAAYSLGKSQSSSSKTVAKKVSTSSSPNTPRVTKPTSVVKAPSKPPKEPNTNSTLGNPTTTSTTGDDGGTTVTFGDLPPSTYVSPNPVYAPNAPYTDPVAVAPTDPPEGTVTIGDPIESTLLDDDADDFSSNMYDGAGTADADADVPEGTVQILDPILSEPIDTATPSQNTPKTSSDGSGATVADPSTVVDDTDVPATEPIASPQPAPPAPVAVEPVEPAVPAAPPTPVTVTAPAPTTPATVDDADTPATAADDADTPATAADTPANSETAPAEEQDNEASEYAVYAGWHGEGCPPDFPGGCPDY